jgi:hypothetical protein
VVGGTQRSPFPGMFFGHTLGRGKDIKKRVVQIL